MKYLRKFNESNSNKELDELQSEANNSLAYLLDDDWEVFVTENGTFGDSIVYSISLDYIKEDEDGGLFYKWKNAKDYVIPYLEMVMSKYMGVTGGPVKDDFNCYYLNKRTDEDTYDNFTLKQLSKKNFLIGSLSFRIRVN